MKHYPYASAPIEDRNSRTTFIVKSAAPLKQEETIHAISDVSLDRTGWSGRHPKFRQKWTFIEVFMPAGFAPSQGEFPGT